MEIGGFFILLLVLIVVAVLGGALYALIATLRHGQLHPDGDKTEPAPEEPVRPEHLAVENEQRERFVGARH